MDLALALRNFALCSHTAPGVPVSIKLSNDGDPPTQRFRKELIRVGHYVKASDGLEFDVTGATLDHWVTSFAAMSHAGVKVPIPVGHTQDATANRGWLVGLEREGDSLYGITELVGTDALALAACSDVSIFVPAAMVDGHGNQYVRPITHVALVTDPVVPGLGAFEAIAASLGKAVNQQEVTVLNRKEAISMADELNPVAPVAPEAAEPVNDTTAQLLATLKNEVAKAFANESLDDAGVLAKVKDLLKARAQIKKLLGDGDPSNDGQAADAAAAVAASLATSDPKTPAAPPIAASQTANPMIVQLAADNRRMKVEALVRDGKVTPAQRDLLVKQYIGDGGSAIALSLSKGVDDGFEAMLKVFEASVANPLGERTGMQILGLSLDNPNNGGGGNSLLANAEARASRFAKK